MWHSRGSAVAAAAGLAGLAAMASVEMEAEAPVRCWGGRAEAARTAAAKVADY